MRRCNTNQENRTVEELATSASSSEMHREVNRTGFIFLSPSTMSGNDTTHCVPAEQHFCLTFFLCLVYTIGLLLNGYSLWVFFFRMSKWSTGMVLQVNLAISDAVASPATPLMAAYFANGNNWEFGRFLCELKIALLSAHFYGSITFLTLISIHRYVVVVHFRRSSRMKQKSFVIKLCLGVWGFLLANSFIYGFLLPVTTEDGHKQCLSIHQTELIDVYLTINFVLLVFGFFTPFAVSGFCYARLARSVTRINAKSQQGHLIKMKSLRMIGICLIIFGLCFLPLNATRTIGVIVKKFFPDHCHLLLQVETAYNASYVVAGVNCCLDPFIYFFGSHNFNKAFKRSLTITQLQNERENKSESETVSNSVPRNGVYSISSTI